MQGSILRHKKNTHKAGAQRLSGWQCPGGEEGGQVGTPAIGNMESLFGTQGHNDH